MRAVVQRVSKAAVSVDGAVVGAIGPGYVTLVGVGHEDTGDDARVIADKIVALRLFPDDAGKMNRALADVSGEVLVVSQFTLLADIRKGRRPSFVGAAEPGLASLLVDQVAERIRSHGIRVPTGVFGAHMVVELTNDGPVTLLLEATGGKMT